MTVPVEAPIPRIALTPAEAAAALGIGETYFTEHVRPQLRLIRRGRKVLIPVAELERWVADAAERAIADEIHSDGSAAAGGGC